MINTACLATVLPAYCTAAGKLFLSQLDDETLETWVRSHNLVPYTANTIIDPDELLKQIRQTRERGYGIVISELYEFCGLHLHSSHQSG